jgi:hypothetical protein
MIHVFLGSNIFGWGTLINQILEADKYGSDPAYVVLGPTATMARVVSGECQVIQQCYGMQY